MVWSNYYQWANMKRSQNIDKPVNRLKEKNSQDGIWAQMSAHSKFSIKAFWKRLCSSLWTPEDSLWPQHQNIKWTKKRKRCASPLGSRSDGVEWYEEEKFCHLSCLRIVIWQWWWLRHWENHCSYQKRESGWHSSVKEQKSPKECYPKKTSLKAMGLEEMAKAIQGMKTWSLNPCFPVLSRIQGL